MKVKLNGKKKGHDFHLAENKNLVIGNLFTYEEFYLFRFDGDTFCNLQ